MWRKGNPFALLVGMQIGATTMESSVEISKKIENGSSLCPTYPTAGNVPKETHITIEKEHKHPYVYCSLFTIADIWKYPKCPSIDELIKHLWDIYIIEYYSDIKKKKILPFLTAWMDLENIMLSEINQSEKDKYHMISFICRI